MMHDDQVYICIASRTQKKIPEINMSLHLEIDQIYAGARAASRHMCSASIAECIWKLE